jgi:hypothetical protein
MSNLTLTVPSARGHRPLGFGLSALLPIVLTMISCGPAQEISEGDLDSVSEPVCSSFPLAPGQNPWAWEGAFPWSSGVIRYSFLTEGTCNPGPCEALTASEREKVTTAMAQWRARLNNQIAFQEDNSAPNLIIEKNFGAGSAEPGGGATALVMPPNKSFLIFNGVGVAAARHELGHVLTAYHEQTRNDRDRYLVMNINNIGAEDGQSCAAAAAPTKSQTYTRTRLDQMRGVFDWGSVMLYSGFSGVNGTHDGSAASYTKRNTSGGSVLCPVGMTGTGTVGTVCGWESQSDVSVLDGSFVLENMNTQYGWRPIISLNHEVNSTTPLVTALDHSTINPSVVAAPAIYYYKDAAGTTHLTAVVRGSDQALWRREATNDVWVANWTKIPNGSFLSDAAGVSWGIDRQDIVALGLDRQVYKLGFHEGAWEGGFTSIGAPPVSDATTLSAPAIASRGTDKLAVFIVGDGSLWTKAWIGGWSSWVNRGRPTGVTFSGGVGFRPAAISTAVDTYDAVIRATDGALWRFQSPSLTWSRVDGGVLAGVGSPAVASFATGRLDIFVRGSGAMALLHQRTIFPDGGVFGWYSNGGVFTSAPAAASIPGQGIDILGLSADHAADPSRADGVWWKRLRP